MLLRALTRHALVPLVVLASVLPAGPAGAAVDNRPPRTPSDVRPTGDVYEMSPGHFAVQTTTPYVAATVSDPDRGQRVAARFVITYRGEPVWHGKSAFETSGASVSRPVPDGVLENGKRYILRAGAIDDDGAKSARRSAPVHLLVDTESPSGEPEVKAVRHAQAVYEEGEWAGGVGLRGKFFFRNGGDDSAVRYEYSFNDPDGLFDSVDADPDDPRGRSATISFRPTRPGPNELYVQMVDRSGRVGPRRDYDIYVNFPQQLGHWRSDEGTGSIAADSSDHGHDITLSPSTTWTDGVIGHAIHFDTPGDDGSTGEPVVDTRRSFGVASIARLDSLDTTGVLLSQDGSQTSGFGLGYVADDPECPTYGEVTGCFEFWMPAADGHGAATARARAPFVATPGQWLLVAGVYDAAAEPGHELTVYTCTATGPDPVESGDGARSTVWSAKGAFHVGQGALVGGTTDTWMGDIDSTFVYDNAIDEERVTELCYGSGR